MTRDPGRHIEPRKMVLRRRILLAGFLGASLLIAGRAFQLQALEGESWAALAESQHRERSVLPARRGSIYDRDGVPLALSHETFRVSVAPRELRDPGAARKHLAKSLGLGAAQAASATDRSKRWVVLPGRYTAEQRRSVGEMRGVYFERALERFYPQGAVGREVIGVISGDGRALGGIEQQFDELLSGTPGYAVLRRGAQGGTEAAIFLPVQAPIDGADVHLTIDFDLQEIADVALREAMQTTGSAGGDLLISDPRTGEVLAAVSHRGGRSRSLAAITEPYEPGSTLKIFAAAALLDSGRATMDDTVYAERGRWTLGNRTISDSHAAEWLTLADVLRVSSNIGIVKLAQRLTPGEQYQNLRDFGFGTPTGIEYPAESTGRLRRPPQWSKLSPASLAMGYEISVTPLQMSAAYGAVANGGVLMEPHLLREVRSPAGAVIQRREARALRRVASPRVSQQLTEALISAVDDGTATRASLASFEVAGKTGTSRRTGPGGRYETGSYTSTFVGYFPARDPQIVIFVKLDQPQGSYYGGLTAAPVTRETLQGILAARSSGLDGRSLLATRLPNRDQLRSAARASRIPDPSLEGTYVFLLDDELQSADATERVREITVPELRGLLMRDAVRRAHSLGARVRLQGDGEVTGSIPASGSVLMRGDTLLLVGESP